MGKIDPNYLDENKQTYLMVTNYVKTIKLILKHAHIDINIQNPHGNTSIMNCSNYNKVKYLLEKGINPNIQNKNGDTALMLCKNTNIAKLLLKNRADPNIKNNESRTALTLSHGSIDIVYILIKYRTNPFISKKPASSYYKETGTIYYDDDGDLDHDWDELPLFVSYQPSCKCTYYIYEEIRDLLIDYENDIIENLIKI